MQPKDTKKTNLVLHIRNNPLQSLDLKLMGLGQMMLVDPGIQTHPKLHGLGLQF